MDLDILDICANIHIHGLGYIRYMHKHTHTGFVYIGCMHKLSHTWLCIYWIHTQPYTYMDLYIFDTNTTIHMIFWIYIHKHTIT